MLASEQAAGAQRVVAADGNRTHLVLDVDVIGALRRHG